MKPSSKQLRGGGFPRLGLVVAILVHVNVLGPLLAVIFYYGAREEAERPDEVDVAFESVPLDALPPDLPALLDETPPPREPPKLAKVASKDPKKKDPKKEQEKERQKKEVAEKPPEPEVVVPPPPPVPPPPTKAHQKMVDLDNDKEIEPPPDAKYLAQKNNRAEVETRATQTNLEREQKGEEGSQQPGERRDDQQVGDDKAKIAELETETSRAGRKAPEITPHQDPEVPEPENPKRSSSVMALREAVPRRHELTPETADPSLPRDPAGAIAMPKRAMTAPDEAPGRPSKGKRLKLSLTGKDYEYLFGSEANADRRLAQKERSTRMGKHAAKVARVRAALENFIPEVQPGNQTALNTRAAPFAAFITRMHRSIHKLWGFGRLEEWDELPSSSPFNDETLMTKLEIVLNGDGTVGKVTVVNPSRYLGFDSEAIDVVYGAGPYPDPPREIRSGNGKIYIHWSFHRDGRQCATSGVDYFILDNAPSGHDRGDDGPAVPVGPPVPAEAPPAAASGERPRRLERGLGEGPALGRATARTGGRTRAAASSAADGHGHAEGDGHAHSDFARPVNPPPGGAGPQGDGTPGGHRAQDSAAVTVARNWFDAYVRGDVAAMTAGAVFPFRSSTGIAAKSRDELARLLESLVAETPKRTAAPVTVETGAGLRRMLGKLPPGLDDGSGLLFAVSSTDGDPLILVLTHTPSGWKATGLIRR